ncbi:MAG: aminotransferase class I/II-fold pyridoxal phosphate-dependent enzyme [Oscillospiraceae bacterium]|nr:aminotransferase class I/II-fold pyridoxal phosphate-dependent enzyme [Oscillospiraceae bacterium]
MDYNKLIPQKIQDIQPSGIRKFFDIAQAVDGVISLSIGEPDFKTPWAARKEAINILEKGKTAYTANSGLFELRKTVCRYLKNFIRTEYDPEKEVIITVGGSEAIDLAVRAMIEPGDEVLVPEPSFVCYSPIVSMMGGTAVPIVTKMEDKFRLTAQALKEKITPKTKILILPYPNNPTGAVMRRGDLEAIAEVLRDTNIVVVSDEIYAEMTYNGEKHVSIAEIDGMRERTVIISGFSKAYAMTGWRLGYVVGPQPIIKQMLKLHQYCIMSSPTVSQYSAIVAMEKCGADVANMVEEYDMRRRLLVKGFNDMGLDCFEPEGAFYVFPCIKSTGLSSAEFCEKLVYSKKVAVVPGSAFGESGEGFVRVSYAYSVQHLTTALSRIREFLEELNRK